MVGSAVEPDGLDLGRDENTELLEIDEQTIAVVDGAVAGSSGERHLTVFLGNPSDRLTPYAVAGAPLIWIDAYLDGDAVVITGTECPALVPEEPEEPSYADICGERPGRDVVYRFTIAAHTWRLLNDALPGSTERGVNVIGDGAWALVLTYSRDGFETYYHRLDSRSGALTPVPELAGRNNAGDVCAIGDALYLLRTQPGVAPTIVEEHTVRQVTPPEPPLDLRDPPRGRAAGIGAVYWSEDWTTLAGLMLDSAGTLAWHTVAAPPPSPSGPPSGLTITGDTFTAWGSAGAFLWDGREWKRLEGFEGIAAPQRVLRVGDRLVYYPGGGTTDHQLGVT